jgi:hypothetical protein
VSRGILRTLLSLVLELVLLAAPAQEPDPVDAAIGIAQAQAAAGRFDEALATIRDARATSSDPDLVFVEAQLLRLSGDCTAALDRYRDFLATDPPAEDRAVAEANVKTCEDQVEAEPEPPPPPLVEAKPEPPPPPVVTTPPPDDTPPRSKREVAVTIALWSTGAAVLATGAGLYGGAWSERNGARRDTLTLDQYLERERRAEVLSGVGIAGLAVGGAILVAAAIRQAILAKRRRASGVLSSVGRLGGARQR